MFTVDYMLSKFRERPFVPLRLITSSGQSYDITHPDLVLVSKSRIIIGTASNEHPGAFETTSTVSMLHVTDLQEIEVPAKSGSNGTL